MPFQHTVTVRFHEVDRAGITFFGRVFEYCHETFEEVLKASDDSLEACFDEEGWSMPLVHAEADYRRPMRMGERLSVRLTVERVGKRSMTFAYTVAGPDGEERARVKLVHAFIRLSDFGPHPVPERVLRALAGAGVALPADD